MCRILTCGAMILLPAPHLTQMKHSEIVAKLLLRLTITINFTLRRENVVARHGLICSNLLAKIQIMTMITPSFAIPQASCIGQVQIIVTLLVNGLHAAPPVIAKKNTPNNKLAGVSVHQYINFNNRKISY